jgi:PAS domain S-box-containing protein
LRENEEHYRDLVENSLDLICTHDLNGVLLTVNLAAARTLGYEPSELVNRNVREFLSPKSHEEFDAFLSVMREKWAASGFLRLRTKNGETRIWRYTSTLRVEGVQVPFVRGVAHDLTDILQAQKALRKSEERLRVAAEVGRMYAWEWDPATDTVLRSAECAGILGLDGATGDGVAKDYFSLVHPDDRARLWGLATSLTPTNPEYRTEYRRFRTDGALLWLQESGHATFDKAGKMVRLVGMTADITDRKHAQDELAKVGGRLLQAQEEERTRIARELHDDICQQLSLLAIELGRLGETPLESGVRIRDHLNQLQKRAAEILKNVGAISHELHSSKLELLGLKVAVRSLCEEFAEFYKVKIDFIEKDLPSRLPKDISICLFRVAQEALRNGLKHSQAGHFQVQLSGTPGAVHLSVRDEGVGFDPETSMNHRGIGLVSMRERLTLVKGTIAIRSKPQGGTEIHCSVPFASTATAGPVPSPRCNDATLAS